MESLTAIMLKKYKEESNEHNFLYQLPLATIDNMPIAAALLFHKSGRSFIFYVDSRITNKQYFKYSFPFVYNIDYEYTIDDFIEAITKVQELLPIMKFDKLIGKFSTNSISEQEKQCVEILFNTPNVSFIYENCSICQECTTTKTKCGHSLCFPCWEKIKRTEQTDHENIYEHQICPICRAIINTRQLNY